MINYNFMVENATITIIIFAATIDTNVDDFNEVAKNGFSFSTIIVGFLMFITYIKTIYDYNNYY